MKSDISKVSNIKGIWVFEESPGIIQKRQIEEGQIIQWSTEKSGKDKQKHYTEN